MLGCNKDTLGEWEPAAKLEILQTCTPRRSSNEASAPRRPTPAEFIGPSSPTSVSGTRVVTFGANLGRKWASRCGAGKASGAHKDAAAK